jgi:hypothetical protein
VDLSNAMRNAGVEKNALGGRRFASINVRHDADVAITIDGGCTRHDFGS